MPETTSARPVAATRRTGAFASPRHAARYGITLTVLIALAVAVTFGLIGWDNPVPMGSPGFWIIASMRAEAVVIMLFVALCHAFATVAFQTATANRIITPSLLGFEALYRVIQTGLVFFLGASGAVVATGPVAFFSQLILMIALAAVLYGWLLSGRFGNLHLMLLVGVVLGGGLGSLATLMQRVLDPNEFDVLTARLLGNVSNAQTEYLPLVIPISVVVCVVIWLRARRLNLLALGRETSTNLGLRHRREVMITLLLVSILMAMTTSLVGPMTFLGFLTATIAYQFADTYDHRFILPMAVLTGYVILAGAYFILNHIFYAAGAVTVIIELIGGLTFLIVILRKGRL